MWSPRFAGVTKELQMPMNTRRALIVVLASASLLISPMPTSLRAARELVLTWANNGGKFQVATGTHILLSLPSDPANANKWAGGPSNSQILTIAAPPFFIGPAPGTVGNSNPIGMTLFHYLAAKPGRSAINLTYPESPVDPAPDATQFDLPNGAFVPTNFQIVINVN
jgi:hypothetical protein